MKAFVFDNKGQIEEGDFLLYTINIIFVSKEK